MPQGSSAVRPTNLYLYVDVWFDVKNCVSLHHVKALQFHYCSISDFNKFQILLFSYDKSQRDALFLKFILVKNSTCFGQ